MEFSNDQFPPVLYVEQIEGRWNGCRGGNKWEEIGDYPNPVKDEVATMILKKDKKVRYDRNKNAKGSENHHQSEIKIVKKIGAMNS